MEENSKDKSKNKKKAIIEILKILASILLGIFGGSLLQNLYVNSQVIDVSGDDNTVNINSVDDLIKNFNKLSEENETLREQNKDYFEDNKESKNTIENLEKQLGDTPAIELKNLGLCIDGEDKNINKNNSYAIINGVDYYSKDFLDSLISDDTSKTIKDETMFLGRVIADKTSLFSQRIVDEGGASVVENATDAYGNTHINAIKMGTGNNIVFSLDEKYSLLKLKIAISESSYNDKHCTISILADGQEVKTSSQLDKISTKEIEYKDLQINNCSRLEIRCSGDWSIEPLIYEADVYN